MSKAYAARIKDENDLLNSSSGGVMTALSNDVFDKCGVLISCIYDYEKHVMQFAMAETPEERYRMRGSKYIQADIANLYSLIDAALAAANTGPILIIGTPCQVNGARAYLKRKSMMDERVILCDLICHGVTSSDMWQQYIHSIEKKHCEKISYITFKDKRNGWKSPYAFVRTESGKELSSAAYSMLYFSNDFMRDSCYHCKHSSLDRCSDITIGDYWGIDDEMPEFYHAKGNSLIFTHTGKGERLLEDALVWLDAVETQMPACLQPNLQAPTKPSNRYLDVNLDYRKQGLDYVIERYVNYGPGNQLTRKLRRRFLWWKYHEQGRMLRLSQLIWKRDTWPMSMIGSWRQNDRHYEEKEQSVVLFKAPYDCSGCGLCLQVCPRKAISMKKMDGFMYPFIDDDKCSCCKLCIRTCPFK